jgi:hypothetical protein
VETEGVRAVARGGGRAVASLLLIVKHPAAAGRGPAALASAAAASPPPHSIVEWKPHQVRTAQAVQSGQMLPTFDDFCRNERTSLMASLIAKGVTMPFDKIHEMAKESALIAVTQNKCQPQGAVEVTQPSYFPSQHRVRDPRPRPCTREGCTGSFQHADGTVVPCKFQGPHGQDSRF